MKGNKASDLRGKSVEELQNMIADEKAAMYKTRRDMVFRQTTDTAGLTTRRHNIARVLTVLNEKAREEAATTSAQETSSMETSAMENAS